MSFFTVYIIEIVCTDWDKINKGMQNRTLYGIVGLYFNLLFRVDQLCNPRYRQI